MIHPKTPKTSQLTAVIYGIVLLLFATVPQLQAQTNISGIVNTYYPVSAISGTTVTVGTSTGAAHTLAAGDWVMLIQMTGDPAIRAGSNMGKYEVVQVSSVAGSNVTLSALTRTYTTTEKVQLVWIPFSATGFNVTGTVTPLAWNGTTGGIVALKGSTLTLTSNINATGTGFTPLLKPGGSVLAGATLGAGTTVGRGNEGGSGSSPTGGGAGGGGETGGGVSSPTLNSPGGNPGQGGRSGVTISPGVDGGTPTQGYDYKGAIGASGGGGGIFGGGGAGGVSSPTSIPSWGGGGGGVTGGGSGLSAGTTSSGAPYGPAGTGGGSGGVGNGADGIGGGNTAVSNNNIGGTEGSAGAGGGSYGGGGGAGNNTSGGDDGAGGGGGGSYTGGGVGGVAIIAYPSGGNGNAPVSIIPDAAHFLKTSDARLMLGGAGGRGSGFGTFPTYVDGGNGGGIVFLDFASMAGPGDVISNGGAGANAPTTYARSGGGGGGGGQIHLKVGTFTSVVDISATGGVGGTAGADTYHGGVSGAGGGGGGVWIQTNDATTRTIGATESLTNVTVNISAGNAGPSITNPKNSRKTATGGAGGVGLTVVELLPCTTPTPSLTTTPPTCTSYTAQNNGKITLTAATNADKYGVSTGATYLGTPNYAAATAIGTLPLDVQTAIPNTGGTYTIRLFNGANGCFTDQTVTIQPVSCCPTPNCGNVTVSKN